MNKNILLAAIGVVVLVIIGGGGFFGYTMWEDSQKAKAAAEAKAKADADEFAAQQAEAQALAARTKCNDDSSYHVMTLDHDGAPGQDIAVKQKADGQACAYDETEAVFTVKNSDPEYFKAIGGNAMITDVGTGPSGRSFRLYDLGDKKMIVEKKYFGDLSVGSTTLTYQGESKTKATASNCSEYKQFTKDGLTPVLTVEKTIDLKSYSVKEGKTTKCVAAQ